MIPVNRPLFSGNELEYLTECINTGWISSEGPFIQKFEKNFAKDVDRKFGIAVSSGSAALDIAIRALEIGPGDEVIVSTFTIISAVQSIVSSGAIPVLVDSDQSTWNMDVSQIESKITKKTRAILVVHIYGLPVDIQPVMDICQNYNLKLIEDAAEMHGQTYYNQPCGSFGDISTFSFYPNKTITTGEGGMVVTNSEELNVRARKLRNLAFEPNKRRFVHYEIGWNYRMTNLQAALGLAQLEKVDLHIKRKRQIGLVYYDELQTDDKFELPILNTKYSDNIFWVFGLLAKEHHYAEAMVNILRRNKIGTRPFFWCMHEQPVFRKMGLFLNDKFPNAEKLSRNGFYLPSGIGLLDHEILEVIKIFNNAIKLC